MKKIMFSDQYGLTQAILEGRKTMTRRTLPKHVQLALEKSATGVLIIPETAIPEGMSIEQFCEEWSQQPGRPITVHPSAEVIPPKWEDILKKALEYSTYKVGEVVAIAQRYSDMNRSTFPVFVSEKGVFMKTENSSGWNNKMYVQADLMPHQIRITDVRIERIQDISDEDCLREGVRKLESDGCPIMFTFDGWRFKNKVNRCTDSPKEVFEALFKKLSGRKVWDDNPWVFVYEFELVK